jgi:CheY-like chemotaxis protein
MAGVKKKILLVDDDPDFVEITKPILESKGFEVAAAYNGKEGLEQVPKFKPDLIVLDVMMPVMNGREACRKLKANPDTEKIPVILLTAVGEHVRTTAYSHRDVLESNADDYIAKPVRPEVLLERIQRLV